MRVESDEGVEKLRLSQGLGELREGVGDVNCWGFGIGDEIREAD